jgi:Fe-S-cluster containining protein
MLTDLVQIRRLGEQKRPENERLRRHLKTFRYVERRLIQIAEEVESQIDCTACGNCCRTATARIKDRDVVRLARHLRVKPEQFLRDYTEESEEEGRILRREPGHGCVFLEGNLCGVYEARPASCIHFPNLTVSSGGSLESRMWVMPDRACYCPIVYNTLERWKDEVNLPGRGG